MTTGKQCELIGLGPSAITQLEHAYAQNRKTTAAWHAATAVDFAIERGLRLNHDDRLRRELLQQLYAYGVIDKQALANRFDTCFDEYFADELQRAHILADQGLIILSRDQICLVTPLGRLLVRVVAAVFDRYLPPDAFQKGLEAKQSSKVG
jgi:oxygen-independent coproporphyrinogen-3 oxidase